MQTKRKFEQRVLIKNILSTYKKANTGDILAGSFYTEAYNFAIQMSNKYGIEVEKVAGIIAVLSPGTKWEQNKKDTESFLRGKRTGLTTYGQFIEKAVRVIECEDINQIFDIVFNKQGQKTSSFYLNILQDQQAVTIDRHAYRIAVGDTGSGGVRLTPNQYNTIASAYIEAAKKIRIPAPELQAITWNVFKRTNDRGNFIETAPF